MVEINSVYILFNDSVEMSSELKFANRFILINFPCKFDLNEGCLEHYKCIIENENTHKTVLLRGNWMFNSTVSELFQMSNCTEL